jgi:hypothetical protein
MSAYRWLVVALGALGLAALVLAMGSAAASGESTPAATPTTAASPVRDSESNGAGLSISFIDSPLPTCYRAGPGSGVCYIQWSTMSVTASPSSYMISMTVAIGGQVRAYHAGFFQTSMSVPGAMYAPGFRVVCGFPAPGDSSGRGNTYSYEIRARDTSGLGSANYGAVICPADVVKTYLPINISAR